MEQTKLNSTLNQPRRRWRHLWLPLLLVAIGLRVHAQPPNGLTEEKDVVYGEAGGQKLKLDVYRKTGATTPLPAFIAIHGGGWSGGDKRDFAGLCQAAANNGYVAFSLNYRLVTKDTNKWPAQIDDVQRAVRWVRAHATEYGVDPNRIGALGASAGGHLVALLGTSDTRDNNDPELAAYSSRVNCVIDLFGPTDFTVTPPEGGMATVGKAIVLNFLGKTPEEAPEVYRDASPITHIDKKTVPFLIFHGTADPLVPLDQSQRFTDALKKNGTDVELITFEGEGHGFQKPENNAKLLEATKAFLEKNLGAKPAP